jgi:hypothetical protein
MVQSITAFSFLLCASLLPSTAALHDYHFFKRTYFVLCRRELISKILADLLIFKFSLPYRSGCKGATFFIICQVLFSLFSDLFFQHQFLKKQPLFSEAGYKCTTILLSCKALF